VLSCLKKRIFLVTLAIVLLAGAAFSQTSSDISLNLQHKRSGKGIRVPRGGEFRLSLDSPMFSTEDSTANDSNLQSRFASAFSDISSPVSVTEADSARPFSGDTTLQLKSNRNRTRKQLTPIITLNNSYEDNAIGFNDSNSSGLSIAGGNNRLQIYGEFEQRHTPQLSLQPGIPERSDSAIRASAGEIKPASGDQTEIHDKNAALASRYYLEAVYSFKPTLKGKVSFKRSMIDTFESEEKLQVEGIVEANRNVLIKAGYNNEVRPEVAEPRSSNDTKVWTEFILKF